MKIRWMPQALRDLDAIRRFIALDNPTAARRWISKLQARTRSAALSPMVGRTVPELRAADVREVFLKSYRIVYRVRGQDFEVLTVFEGHRLFPHNAMPDDVA